MDHIYPSALHENPDVAFKYCPNKTTAGKMKKGKAGQTNIPSQSPHVPKFWLCHKGRVNLRINEAGPTAGGCLQPGGCSKLPLRSLLWQLSDSFYFTNNHGWLPNFELQSGGVLRFSRSLVFSGVQLKHVMWSEMCFPCFKRSSRRKLGGASGPFFPLSIGWLENWKRICFCVNVSLWTIFETHYLELCEEWIFFFIWLPNQKNQEKSSFQID